MDTMNTTEKDIVVIYHAKCPDGFGAAYAAWKKFGDNASYIPQKTQESIPDGLQNKELYIVDYSYDKETLAKLTETNKSVVVIDHHESAREAVTSFVGNVFDLDHSGAVLAWRYFHPTEPTPKLLLHVEDSDLWRFKLPETKAVMARLWQTSFDFASWDQLAKDFEDEDKFKEFVTKGEFTLEQKQLYIKELLTYKEKVEFDGHPTLAVNCARPYRSDVGNFLAKETGTLGIVWYHYEGAFHVSMRSIGDFSVADLAKKFGGGGHKNAASARFDRFEDIPMKFVDIKHSLR